MLTPEDVLAFEKTFTDKKTYRRFLCIKLHVIDQQTQRQIAAQTGYNLRHVQRLHAQVQEKWTSKSSSQDRHCPTSLTP